MGSKTSTRKVISINLLILIVLLVLAEFCLHILFVYSGNPKVLNYASTKQLLANGLSQQYSPHRYLGYIPTPGWQKERNAHNSLGFRGREIDIPKVKGTYRIVCIGGSTTYTTEVEDYQKSYPFLLESELREQGFNNVEVINSGAGNWSTWESLINLQLRLLDLEPDMLIIYHATNDIQTRLVWPPSKYVGDNSGRRVGLTNTRSWRTTLQERSNLLRILSIKSGLKIPNTSLESIDPAPESYLLPEYIRQLAQNEYPSGIFTEISASMILEANRPVFFKRNLENMVTLAKSKNTAVLMATFAHCTGYDSEFSSTPVYEKAYEEHNQIIEELAMEKGTLFLDFAKLFPNQKELFADGRHVNEQGSALKAQIFARKVSEYLQQKQNTTGH